MARDNTARLRLLVSYFLGEARFNQTKAAELAGYAAKDRKTLTSLASQLFDNPVVKKMIEEKINEVEMTQAEILSEMARLARWDHEDDTPDTSSLNANAEVKFFDTKMRAKLTALNGLLKLNTFGLSDKIAKLQSAFEKHREDHPDVTDEKRAEIFKEHVPAELVDEMLRKLMSDAKNRARLAETEAVIKEPMLEATDAA